MSERGELFFKKVYYSKHLYIHNQPGIKVTTMVLEYPRSYKKDFDVIIPRIEQSFRDF